MGTLSNPLPPPTSSFLIRKRANDWLSFAMLYFRGCIITDTGTLGPRRDLKDYSGLDLSSRTFCNDGNVPYLCRSVQDPLATYGYLALEMWPVRLKD